MDAPGQPCAVGQRLTVKAKRVLPFGVFIEMPDGTEGYIRRRELTLARNVEPEQIVKDGDDILAIVVAVEAGRLIELSHRLILPDPWVRFRQTFRVGSIVNGSVRSLLPGGIFVEIIPGVDGFVPELELGLGTSQSPEDVFWEGDCVSAVITRIDDRTKRASLSIRQRLAQVDRAIEVAGRVRLSAATAEHARRRRDVAPRMEARRFVDGAERIGRILVLDDQQSICAPLVQLLLRRGYQAAGVSSVSAGLEQFSTQAPNVLLLDLNLEGEDGLELLQRVREQGIHVTVAVTGTPKWLQQRFDELVELEVEEAFPKPLILDDILDFLSRLSRREMPGPSHKRLSLMASAPKDDETLQPLWELHGALQSNATLKSRLQAGLEYVVKWIGAESGAVFHIDSESRQASVAGWVGGHSPFSDTHFLLDSPVENVIRNKSGILENSAGGRGSAKFRRLFHYLGFESCIGVPIVVAGEVDHALFLFHEKPDRFSSFRFRDAQAAAMSLGVILEGSRMEQSLKAASGILATGQLAAGLEHEVYNRISGLDLLIGEVTSCVQPAARSGRKVTEDLDDAKAASYMQMLLDTSLDLKRIVTLFQELLRVQSDTACCVNELIRDTKRLLQAMAQKEGVKVTLQLDADLPAVTGNPAHMRQVFSNLMLNAIQLMAINAHGGTLQVETRHVPTDSTHPVGIRFIDQGPGIHRRHWDKIFALGFSTRPQGTGLGLFVARTLIESLGGRISVEESTVPLGTTFLIELPSGEPKEAE